MSQDTELGSCPNCGKPGLSGWLRCRTSSIVFPRVTRKESAASIPVWAAAILFLPAATPLALRRPTSLSDGKCHACFGHPIGERSNRCVGPAHGWRNRPRGYRRCSRGHRFLVVIRTTGRANPLPVCSPVSGRPFKQAALFLPSVFSIDPGERPGDTNPNPAYHSYAS